MEFFKKQTSINFIGTRRYGYLFSAILVTTALLTLTFKGLNFGLDFTGGTLVEAHFSQPVELPRVKEALEAGGFADPGVQHVGSARDVMVRLPPLADEKPAHIGDRVLTVLRGLDPQATQQRVEFVGPQVGNELRDGAIYSVLVAMACLLIYLSARFELRLSAGAIIALFHDTIIVVGIFSLFGITFDLSVLAAILAVIGYSLNDTVVVYDRIRDEARRNRTMGLAEVMNLAINVTLSRTVMTSLTTLITVAALLVIGGPTLFGFSLALVIGIVKGTYSSIYIASALALDLGLERSKLLPTAKPAAEAEGRP